MRDSYDEMKRKARAKEMLEAEHTKQSFIREVRNGLGADMEKDLRLQLVTPPPTKWKLFIRRLKKILGI